MDDDADYPDVFSDTSFHEEKGPSPPQDADEHAPPRTTYWRRALTSAAAAGDLGELEGLNDESLRNESGTDEILFREGGFKPD